MGLINSWYNYCVVRYTRNAHGYPVYKSTSSRIYQKQLKIYLRVIEAFFSASKCIYRRHFWQHHFLHEHRQQALKFFGGSFMVRGCVRLRHWCMICARPIAIYGRPSWKQRIAFYGSIQLSKKEEKSWKQRITFVTHQVTLVALLELLKDR